MKLKKKKKKFGCLGKGIIVLLVACCLIAIVTPSDSDEEATQALVGESQKVNSGVNVTDISNEIESQIETLDDSALDKVTPAEKTKVQVLNGNKKYTYSDGAVYNGEFVDGKRDGKGTLTYSDGSVYSGEWKKNKISGDGKYTFADGSTLKGKFKSNQFLNGQYKYSNKIGTFTVYLKDTKAIKEIKVKLKNGDTYQGTLSKGTFNGKCTIVYKDGDTYSGNVVDNLKSGKGKYTWSTGEHYSGQWSEDKMDGTGQYYYSSDSIPYLKGEFFENKPEGKCVYYKTTKKKYNTYWEDGVCTKITS